jgi:uncharacterized protein (TIGR02099 family)
MSETDIKHQTGFQVLNWNFRRLSLHSLRVISGLFLTVLVLVTLYLILGRLLMPLVGTQREWVERRLLETLGVDIKIGELEGDWFAYSPIFRLYDIELIQSQDLPGAHQLKELGVTLNIPQSLLQGQLIIDRVIIDEMSLSLEENENGRWALLGLGFGETDNSTDLLNILFNTSRVQLSESQLRLETMRGVSLSLNNIYLDIENTVDEHQAQLQFRINQQPNPLQMAIQLQGNPLSDFEAQTFLDIPGIDLMPLLAGSAQEQVNFSRFDAGGQLWLDFNEQNIKQAQALLENLNLSVEFSANSQAVQINAGSVELAAMQDADNNWQVWAQNLQFDLFNRPWESGDFFIELLADEQDLAISLQAESLDLAIASDVLEALNLPDSLRSVLADLSPKGQLHNVHLQTDVSGNYPGGFKLAANLDELELGAWNQAPSGSGINGYLEADQTSGLLELDSSDFNVHLPRLFEDSWHFNAINGRVLWETGAGRVNVRSDVIDVRNQNLHGRFQFELNNYQLEQGGWDANLTLLIGVLDFDAVDKSLYLPRLSSISGTMDWLDAALLSGHVENSAFVYRGKTANALSPFEKTVQTYYYGEDINLRFLEDWPALENTRAFVKVDNDRVDITSDSAMIADIALGETTAQVRPLLGLSGAWLTVDSDALAGGDVGLDFLRNTPVRETVGDFLDEWLLQGNVELEIDLGIALNNPDLVNDIRINAITFGNALTIPAYDLQFDEIYGPISFQSTDGLRANGLSARLFNYPLALRINTEDERLMIRGNGRVSRASLQDWGLQSEFVRRLLDYSEGELSYETQLSIAGADEEGVVRSELNLSSDLTGVALNLPRPLDKRQDENARLNLRFNIGQNLEQIGLDFRDQLSANLSFRQGNLRGGEIHLGVRDENFLIRTLNNEPGLLINGSISDFDLEEWQTLGMSFSGSGETSASDIVRVVDLDIGKLHALGLDLPAINTVLRRQGGGWSLYLENEQLQGDFIFPDDPNQPYEIELSYLRLPRDENPEAIEMEVEEEEIDILANVDPTQLPAMNFSTQEFSLGDGNLGTWSFQLRSSADGANITDLRMQSSDASILALSGEGGATLDWQYINGEHHSSFNGLFTAGNLAQVLPSFGYDAAIESEEASFNSRLAWSGSPAMFALKKVSGRVDLQMQNGSFIDIESGSARLFGAFNFDSIVRRLQLDFSDLYERGLAYDTISGILDFNDGIVRTRNNFLIRGPSSTINVNGQLDLVQETIDADVLINLPLGQNVSMVAGILGAWPIAITTYVASIVFRDQLENFTTVLYRLDGPWDDPEARFESNNEAVEEAMEEVGVLIPDAE